MTEGRHQRRSIFPGLLLIVLGAIFLLHRFDPAFGVGHLIRVYWPLLIILWGVAKLIDHFAAQSTGQSAPSAALRRRSGAPDSPRVRADRVWSS